MSYFPAGHRVTASEIDDFSDCDTAAYGGGYDIDLTYGRSLPPSDEICYPHRHSRPPYASHAERSAYSNEYKRNSGPRARPGPSPSAGGRKPNYGFHPGGGRRPGYGDSSRGPATRGWNPGSDFGGSRNGGGQPERPTYPDTFYPEPSYPETFYPEPNYPEPSYPEPSFPTPNYPEPRFPAPGYGLKKYGHDSPDSDEKRHHHGHGHHR